MEGHLQQLLSELKQIKIVIRSWDSFPNRGPYGIHLIIDDMDIHHHVLLHQQLIILLQRERQGRDPINNLRLVKLHWCYKRKKKAISKDKEREEELIEKTPERIEQREQNYSRREDVRCRFSQKSTNDQWSRLQTEECSRNRINLKQEEQKKSLMRLIRLLQKLEKTQLLILGNGPLLKNTVNNLRNALFMEIKQKIIRIFNFKELPNDVIGSLEEEVWGLPSAVGFYIQHRNFRSFLEITITLVFWQNESVQSKEEQVIRRKLMKMN
ncbi:unnamed protein product [Paramecium octaurelia]|uniref:Uncharacterized protein n=1 Tax=Paramecium octaurelia TaxID=43137 RepID=A0A8S1WHD0_PAROT|nr:unnamed protein product [Paramecium octaurelia]